MAFNFSPPAIDFSPLGRLGETYDRSVKRTRDAEVAANRERALAGFGQNGDLAALGTTLLRAGDLEGGMQALRLDAAQKGSPFQRERAAAEDARAAEADAYRRRQEDENNRRYEESKTRADRPERFTQEGTDPDTGMPTLREGWKYPDGSVRWSDGKIDRPPPGPQSGGIGDPNLPDPGSVAAQTMAPPGGNPPDYGYVLPGASGGQYQPMGTVRMPRPDAVAPPGSQGRAAVAAPPTPSPDVPAAGAQPQQAQQAPVVAAPNASTVPRRATRADPLEPDTVPFVRWPPLNVNAKEWVAAETKRLAALAGGGSEKLTKEQTDARAAAGKMEGAEQAFRPNEGETISVAERLKSVIAPGNSENFITSEGYQKGVAAKKEWIAGLLRKESGAAVTPDEFTYYNDIYFPAVGQGGAVALQKAQARDRALAGVKAGMTPQQIVELGRTGGGAPASPSQGTPAAPAGPASPAVPETAKTAPNGIRFW